MGFYGDDYPLVMTKIAIEHGHLWLVCRWKMVMFHSCGSLPGGKMVGIPTPEEKYETQLGFCNYQYTKIPNEVVYFGMILEVPSFWETFMGFRCWFSLQGTAINYLAKLDTGQNWMKVENPFFASARSLDSESRISASITLSPLVFTQDSRSNFWPTVGIPMGWSQYWVASPTGHNTNQKCWHANFADSNITMLGKLY